MNVVTGLELLRETCKPLVVSIPDSETQVLVRRVMGDGGYVQTIVDVRSCEQASWVPIELCGGKFEVRDQ